MIYKVIVLDKAEDDLSFLKKSEINTYNKAKKLLIELKDHPRIGTGKPELMKHGKLKGLWSRRITDKHRLVYAIKDSEVTVLVLSARGHYDDK